jgi:hypothetical protein
MRLHRKTKKATAIKVVVDIRPGPASPAQLMLFRKLFTKLISEAIESEDSQAVLPTTSKPLERDLDEHLSE